MDLPGAGTSDKEDESLAPGSSSKEDEVTEAVSSPLGPSDAGSSVGEPEGTGSLKREGGAVDSGTDSLP